MDFITQHILALISTSGGVVPAFIDYLSVIAGVLTGALVACDRKLDIIGVTVLGLVTMVLLKPRSWCVYCPMGTMTQLICRGKHRGEAALHYPAQGS